LPIPSRAGVDLRFNVHVRRIAFGFVTLALAGCGGDGVAVDAGAPKTTACSTFKCRSRSKRTRPAKTSFSASRRARAIGRVSRRSPRL